MQKSNTLSERSESKGFVPILIVLLTLAVIAAGGGYYYWSKNLSKINQAPIQSEAQATPSQAGGATATDKTANWKTYRCYRIEKYIKW